MEWVLFFLLCMGNIITSRLKKTFDFKINLEFAQGLLYLACQHYCDTKNHIVTGY
jgi:ferritin